MRDCIYIFGVVWEWMEDGIRGEYGEDDGMGDLEGRVGDDLSVENWGG